MLFSDIPCWHAGPIIGSEGRLVTQLPDEQRSIVMEYRNLLVERLMAVVGAALNNFDGGRVRIRYGRSVVRQKQLPGATAMFLMVCGADQNPNPRGGPEHVEAQGAALARTVLHVAGRKLDRISGGLSAALRVTNPALAEPSARAVPYPIQAVRFGRSLTIVALGGEVVAEYARRIERRVMSGVRDVLRRVAV